MLHSVFFPTKADNIVFLCKLNLHEDSMIVYLQTELIGCITSNLFKARLVETLTLVFLQTTLIEKPCPVAFRPHSQEDFLQLLTNYTYSKHIHQFCFRLTSNHEMSTWKLLHQAFGKTYSLVSQRLHLTKNTICFLSDQAYNKCMVFSPQTRLIRNVWSFPLRLGLQQTKTKTKTV